MFFHSKAQQFFLETTLMGLYLHLPILRVFRDRQHWVYLQKSIRMDSWEQAFDSREQLIERAQ
jgi:hypothetical protein